MPSPLPPPTPLSLFQKGERYFESGDFEEAAKAYEEYLKKPEPKNNPAALFHLGMAKVLSGGNPRDLHQAETALKSLVAKFPNSPYTAQAEYLLSLQAQIERLKNDVRDREDKIRELTDELQKLKEIDLQRRPSRPPQ